MWLDSIVTIGGFYGRIVSVKDDVVVINLGGDNKVKIEKAAVRTVLKAAADEEETDEE